MEHERLSEAKRIFNDDKLRFEKYISEQEIDIANSLQEEIEKIETEIR